MTMTSTELLMMNSWVSSSRVFSPSFPVVRGLDHHVQDSLQPSIVKALRPLLKARLSSWRAGGRFQVAGGTGDINSG